jgi:hypothetical protein
MQSLLHLNQVHTTKTRENTINQSCTKQKMHSHNEANGIQRRFAGSRQRIKQIAPSFQAAKMQSLLHLNQVHTTKTRENTINQSCTKQKMHSHNEANGIQRRFAGSRQRIKRIAPSFQAVKMQSLPYINKCINPHTHSLGSSCH